MNETSEVFFKSINQDMQEDDLENDISVSETVIDYSESIRLLNNNLVFIGCSILLVIGIVSGVLLGRCFSGIFRD